MSKGRFFTPRSTFNQTSLPRERCACGGGGASDTPRHQGWVGPRRSERGFINLSIGVVRRHVRFGVVHEGYNHEPGTKDVMATLHACGSLRRTGSSGACGGRRGKGGAIASRGFHRTRGALKQYEYPICEITKTGLLPPGVINTGEFVHHRAWVGCGSRTPRRAFLFIKCYRSLANWSRAGMRTCQASQRGCGRSAQRMPLAHSNLASASGWSECEPSASQIEARAGESGCVRSLGPANEPCSGSAQLQPAKLYLASHRHSRRRAGVQNCPKRATATQLPAKSRGPSFKQLRRDSTHGRNRVRYDAGGRDAQAQAAEESFQTAVGCASL